MIGTTPEGEEFTYYAVREELPLSEVYHNPFLRDNVLPHLPLVNDPAVGPSYINREDPSVKPGWVIRNEVREFIRSLHPHPTGEEARNGIELWADYSAYDHVVFAQIFGSMMDLPPFVPMFTHDVQAFRSLTGAPESLFTEAALGSSHHALNDARQCLDRFEAVHTWAMDQLYQVNSADPFVESEEDRG